MMRVEDAKGFIESNARPLELALYHFYIGKKPKEGVIEELKKYQNDDGGFGKGLEPDNFNPHSNPIAVNDALFTLHRIGGIDVNSALVKGMIQYLSSHDSYDEEQKKWLFAIESNQDYPHAIWWEKGDTDGISGFNPTISLAAFLVCMGEGIDYYSEIVRAGFSELQRSIELSNDSLKCFLLAYELLKAFQIDFVINLEAMFPILQEKIYQVICKDVDKYGNEYVATPSDFFDNRHLEFINDEIQKWVDIERKILDKLLFMGELVC